MNIEWAEVGKWIAGLFAVAVGGGLVVRFTRSSSQNSQTSIVSQKNNTAGGDIIAGNSVKNEKK